MDQNNADDKNNAEPKEKLPPFDDYPDELPLAVQVPLMPNQGTVFDYYVDWDAYLIF